MQMPIAADSTLGTSREVDQESNEKNSASMPKGTIPLLVVGTALLILSRAKLGTISTVARPFMAVFLLVGILRLLVFVRNIRS